MDSVFCERHVNCWCTIVAHVIVVSAATVVLIIKCTDLKPQYGRFYNGPWWAGRGLNPRISWILQELPAFLCPFYTLIFCVDVTVQPVNAFLLGLFCVHYFNRTFIYPLLIKGGKPSSVLMVFFAFLFCALNGFIQSHHFLCIAEYPSSYHTHWRFLLGVVVFVFGFVVNVHSDSILRNLRKPGETGYRIPIGGMFEYVSSANLFGEIVEWWGFWIASSGYSPFVFAAFTTVFLATKADLHQRFYLEKFDDYPTKRKIVFPFIW